MELEIQSMEKFKLTSETLLNNGDTLGSLGIKAIRETVKSKVNGLNEMIGATKGLQMEDAKELRSKITPIASRKYGLPENANTAFVLGW